MPRITFIENDGREHEIEAQTGASVMEMARAHNVPGLDADCGGGCSCGTCHVYVSPEWRTHIGEPNEFEVATLEFAVDVEANSRLSCQIKMTDELDGLVVTLPASQR